MSHEESESMLGLMRATGTAPSPALAAAAAAHDSGEDGGEAGGGAGGAAPGSRLCTIGGSTRREISLLEYRPETMMRTDATVVVLGPRGSGKTVFMKYLLWCMRKKIDLPVVFCPSRDTREEYQKFIPRSQVYPVYSKARLSSIYDTQRKISAQAKAAGMQAACEGNAGPHDEHHGLRNLSIILDDCMFDKEEVRGKAIRAVMMNGRHEHIFFVNAVQYVVDFPKDLRSQLDVMVIFPLSGLYLKSAYEHMLNGAFDSYEDCVTTFKSLREHECLVFDAKAKAKKKPYLFFCKAKYDLPNFRVGADWVWFLYYKYMVRPENTAQHLRREIALTLAIAKGQMEDPEKLATKTVQAPTQGIVVRRYPAAVDVPVLEGPGPGPGLGPGPGPSPGTGHGPPPRHEKRKGHADADDDAEDPQARQPRLRRKRGRLLPSARPMIDHVGASLI